MPDGLPASGGGCTGRTAGRGVAVPFEPAFAVAEGAAEMATSGVADGLR